MEAMEIDNPRYPHRIKIVRRSAATAVSVEDDDPLAENTSTPVPDKILYDGMGRAYTDTTTYGSASVDRNKRKASIPVRFNEWEEGAFPLDGDRIETTKGSVVEHGVVRDCEPDNNRTVIYWDFVRV